jgi:uncharacterized protein (TIGR04255 family)
MELKSVTETFTRVTFQSPPVNELVIGIRFPPVLELKAQHIGIYWQSIRERFPECVQQMPHIMVIEGSPGPGFPEPAPGEVFPLPRFWFLSNEHPLVIQVQRDAFWLNWRRGPNSGDYPNYENVEAAFWQEFEMYKTFLDSIGQSKLSVVSRCELTYVNLITPNAFFSAPADVARVLPALRGFADAQNEQRNLVGLNASATYQLNENLFIDSFSRLGKRNDTKELVAALELKAYGAPSDLLLESCGKWFKAAHEATYNLFLTVTDKEVQQSEWKPR